MAEIDLRQGWSLSLAASMFYRRTHYKYYPNVKANTFEIRGGLLITCNTVFRLISECDSGNNQIEPVLLL